MALNRLNLRSDTTSEWSITDPVLGLNELVYDTTRQDLKLGDGSSTFVQLPYLLQGQRVWRGLFVPGFYAQGQYVEAADGLVYRARRTMLSAQAQPVAGPNWVRMNWGGAGGSAAVVAGATITEWEPGTYPPGLVTVLNNFTLYQLTAEDRPFDSSDFELEKDFGQWTPICCEGGGGGTGGTGEDYLQAEDGRRLQAETGQYFTV